MDGIDIAILKYLDKDARKKLNELAISLNVPTPTIYLRYNKLKENGIAHTSVVLDKRGVESIGLNFVSFLIRTNQPDVDGNSCKEFESLLHRIKSFCEDDIVAAIATNSVLMIVISFRSLKNYKNIKKIIEDNPSFTYQEEDAAILMGHRMISPKNIPSLDP
jgi:DNA-binding Lrp family transcriptional regulator